MAENTGGLVVERPIVRDILEVKGAPALSATSDMPVAAPVVETKPDASPPAPTDQTAAPTPDANASEAGKTPAESATADTKAPEKPSADDTPTEEQPKKAQGVQKRLDELTKQREEANRRAEAADQRLDRALAALEKATGAPAEETKQKLDTEDPQPQRPVRSAFDDLDAYEAALLDFSEHNAAWVARREVKAARAEYERQRTEQKIADEQTKVREAYNTRKAKVVEEHPDFDQVATNPEVVIPGLVAQAIVHDEQGPQLQYYFGKNPDEAARLMKLENPYLQLVELGFIKAKLAQPASAPQKEVSAAPPPIRPVRTSGSETPPPTAEQSAEAYAAMVRKREGWADPQAKRQRR